MGKCHHPKMCTVFFEFIIPTDGHLKYTSLLYTSDVKQYMQQQQHSIYTRNKDSRITHKGSYMHTYVLALCTV